MSGGNTMDIKNDMFYIMMFIGLIIFLLDCKNINAMTLHTEFSERDVQQEQYEKDMYKRIDQNVVVIGDVSQDNVRIAKRIVKSSNLELVESFLDSGAKFYICGNDAFENIRIKHYGSMDTDGGRLLGWIEYNGNLFVRAETEGNIRETIPHELGHWLAKQLDWVDESTEFKRVFNDEYSRSGLHDYFDNPIEYFAGAYWQYRHNYDQFRLNCPQTCRIMKEYETRLSERRK